RGREHRRGVGQRKEARLDVRLTLDGLEMQRQEVLDSETAGALGDPLAVEELLRLDALLRGPHTNLVAHRDLDAPAATQALDDFRQRGLHNSIAHAGDERNDGDALLAGRDSRDVAG